MENFTGMSEAILIDIATWIFGSGSTNSPIANCTIHFAAYKGYFTFVKKLLADGVDSNSKDKSSNTPLILAAEGGHLKIVKLLIENNADLSIVNESKETAIFAASKSGNSEVVRLFIEKGLNVNCVCTTARITPLHVSSYFGHTKGHYYNMADIMICNLQSSEIANLKG